MADWRKLYEEWDKLSPEMKKKLETAILKKKEQGKLEEFYQIYPPYTKMIAEKLLGDTLEKVVEAAKPGEPTEFAPPRFQVKDRVVHKGFTREVTEVIPGKPVHYMLDGQVKAEESELKNVIEAYEQKWKSGDKAVYKWTGEELEVMSIDKWPIILLKDKFGHIQSKNTDQLVTAKEYEQLKAEQAARLGKKIPEKAAAPKVRAETAAEIERRLRDIFYTALTKEGVPITEGYRAWWRNELMKILQMATQEEREARAADVAVEVIDHYKASKEKKVAPRAAPAWREREREGAPWRPPKLPSGWKPVEGGYLVNGRFVPEAEAPKEMGEIVPTAPRAPEEPVLLTGIMRRRCPHEDHTNAEWVKKHPEVEEQWPGGEFMADLEEERAAHCLPCPAYYRDRRFQKYCPWHRHVMWKVYITEVGKWVEVYMWMFKVSGGRQGLDPGVVRRCGLSISKYEKPVTWHPPKAVFAYWRDIGWAIPTPIAEVWEKEDKGEPVPSEEEIFKRLVAWEEEEREKRTSSQV